MRRFPHRRRAPGARLARLVAHPARPPDDVGLARPGTHVPRALVLDLIAAVVGGGAAPSAAVAVVAEALTEVGDPLAEVLQGSRASSPGSVDREVVEAIAGALVLAEVAGISPAGPLRSAADALRRTRARAATVAARRLSVVIVLPTALCLLPAFLLLGVVPVVIDLLRSALGG